MINTYSEEKECNYKNERYSVRDNGAVLKHTVEGKRLRPTDNVWTFGKPNNKTGYMEIAGERVHRIVAYAFLGKPPTNEHVVDHIDTNKRNNRPENLRWVTRLENVLLNPITAKRIAIVCGSVEKFLEDPSKFRDKFSDPNYNWMCTVSKEEAQISLHRMLLWAHSEKESFGGILDKWIFSRSNYVNTQAQQQPRFITLERINTESQSQREYSPQIRKSPIPQPMPQILVKRGRKVPDGFPYRLTDQIEESIKYGTPKAIINLIQELLNINHCLMLPDISLSTCGRNIVIEKAHMWQFEKIESIYDGRSQVPKFFLLTEGIQQILVCIKADNNDINSDKLNKFIVDGINIVKFDFTWAKEAFTREEIVHILSVDYFTKKWLYHTLIEKAEESLIKVCEPMIITERGLAMHVDNCPIGAREFRGKSYANWIDDCCYCNYRFENERFSGCFGKSKINTYDELLNIVDIIKKDEQIIGITLLSEGKTISQKFEFVDTDALGKTLIDLWDEKKGDTLIAHNIVSDWYVLLEQDPRLSIASDNSVYARLSKHIEGLRTSSLRSIWGYDDKDWELAHIE